MSIFDDNTHSMTYIEQLQCEMKEIAIESVAYCVQLSWFDPECVKKEFCSRMFDGHIIHKYENVVAYQIYVKRVSFWWIKRFVTSKIFHMHLSVRFENGDYIQIYNDIL